MILKQLRILIKCTAKLKDLSGKILSQYTLWYEILFFNFYSNLIKTVVEYAKLYFLNMLNFPLKIIFNSNITSKYPGKWILSKFCCQSLVPEKSAGIDLRSRVKMALLMVLLQRTDELLMNMVFKFYNPNKLLLHPITSLLNRCF